MCGCVGNPECRKRSYDAVARGRKTKYGADKSFFEERHLLQRAESGCKGRAMLQEPLPGVLDHREFERVRVEIGWCGGGTGRRAVR